MFQAHASKIASTIALALVAALVFSHVSSSVLEKEVTAAKPVASKMAAVHASSVNNSAAPSTSSSTAIESSSIPKSKVSQGAKKRASTMRSSPAVTRSAAKTKRWQQITISGNTLRISRADFNHITTKGLAPILHTARMEPAMQDGKVQGFRLVMLARGSLWEAAGLRKNDLFKSVNGIPLNDAGQAIKALQNSRRASTIQVEFMRGNQLHRRVIEIR